MHTEEWLAGLNYVEDDNLDDFFESNQDVAVVVNGIHKKIGEIQTKNKLKQQEFKGVIYKNNCQIAKQINSKPNFLAKIFSLQNKELKEKNDNSTEEENDHSTDFTLRKKKLVVVPLKSFTDSTVANVAHVTTDSNIQYLSGYTCINAILYKTATEKINDTSDIELDYLNGKKVFLASWAHFAEDTKKMPFIRETTSEDGKYNEIIEYIKLDSDPISKKNVTSETDGGKRNSRKRWRKTSQPKNKDKNKKNTRKSKLIRRRKAKKIY